MGALLSFVTVFLRAVLLNMWIEPRRAPLSDDVFGSGADATGGGGGAPAAGGGGGGLGTAALLVVGGGCGADACFVR